MSLPTTEKKVCACNEPSTPPTSRCIEIHTKLIPTHRLLKVLEKRLQKGTYNVEMRQNIFYIYIDQN
jgi:hypothetical protein